jgi:hypothetical protein
MCRRPQCDRMCLGLDYVIPIGGLPAPSQESALRKQWFGKPRAINTISEYMIGQTPDFSKERAGARTPCDGRAIIVRSIIRSVRRVGTARRSPLATRRGRVDAAITEATVVGPNGEVGSEAQRTALPRVCTVLTKLFSAGDGGLGCLPTLTGGGQLHIARRCLTRSVPMDAGDPIIHVGAEELLPNRVRLVRGWS